LYVLNLGALVLCACDLQPKISSIPDSVGMFIEDRYPALLADPQSQPEIYNSAVTDYGVYASPELYGSSNIDDYVLYASVDDYVLVPEKEESIENESETTITYDAGFVEQDTSIADAEEDDKEDEDINEYLVVPVYGGNTVIDEIETEALNPQKPTETVAVKEQETVVDQPKTTDEIIVHRGDTVYSLARKNNMTMAEFAKINNLQEPYTLRIGQKLTTRTAAPEKSVATKVAEKPVPNAEPTKTSAKPVPNVISEEKVKQIKANRAAAKESIKPTSTKRVDLQEITVSKGDTLYSLSRKYQIPVNDLAVMNKLTAPFNLSVGQKLKVPKLDAVQTRPATVAKTVKKSSAAKNESVKDNSKNILKDKAVKNNTIKSASKKTEASVQQKQTKTPIQKEQKTQTVAPKKSTASKIVARSSSKFTWPVRGAILSGYGPKNNGLVNDGINISASLGTVVKAAENGVVAYAGNEVKGMGNLIIIQHSDGWMTVYAHLDSMSVRRGAQVSVGQPIGKIGKTGKVDKPQLHFEIRKGTKSYNPTLYLKK